MERIDKEYGKEPTPTIGHLLAGFIVCMIVVFLFWYALMWMSWEVGFELTIVFAIVMLFIIKAVTNATLKWAKK